MNMRKIFSLILTAASAIVMFYGCDNAEYKIIRNSVYLSDADGITKSRTLTVEGELDIPITVRLAQKVDSDVTVSLVFSQEDLDIYNSANSTEYQCMEDLPSDVTVTIPAGSITANYTLHVGDYAASGVTYAIPVRLDNVNNGDVMVSSGQGKFVYVLSKPLIVSVPVMKGVGSEGTGVIAGGEWGFEVNAWTFEAWIRMSGYNTNNQSFFRSGTTNPGNIFMRFGDSNRPFNYLQVKLYGGEVKTEANLEAGKWYHWAMVYDGTTFTIYRNGEKDVEFQPTRPAKMVMEYARMMDTGSMFRDECSISQARFWKVARTQTEIQANMYYEVNPDNSGLIAYWPMDDKNGNIFRDISGNGRDMTAADGVIQRWEDGIRFDGK